MHNKAMITQIAHFSIFISKIELLDFQQKNDTISKIATIL